MPAPTTITFVKKILADGSPCAKCADVEAKLDSGGHRARIDETLVADERDAASPGMRLAAELQVDRAPFFVVARDGRREVYTSYLQFAREVLSAPAASSDAQAENEEILRNNTDLDFL
jgi:hypothetical protein